MHHGWEKGERKDGEKTSRKRWHLNGVFDMWKGYLFFRTVYTCVNSFSKYSLSPYRVSDTMVITEYMLVSRGDIALLSPSCSLELSVMMEMFTLCSRVATSHMWLLST